MQSKHVYLLLALVVAITLCFGVSAVALAGSQYIQQIPAIVENKSCTLCHTANYPELNADGQAWVKAGKDWSVFTKAAQPAAEKPAAGQPAAAGGEKAAPEELPKTGGNPYTYMSIGAIMVVAGLLLGRKRACRDQ